MVNQKIYNDSVPNKASAKYLVRTPNFLVNEQRRTS